MPNPKVVKMKTQNLALFGGLALLFAGSAVLHAQTEVTLYSFTGGSDGYAPMGQLILDSSGNLYGTDFFGSAINDDCPSGCGVVFRLTKSGSSWTYETLHTFVGNTTDVGHPSGALAFDSSGNLYGTGQTGASSDTCYQGSSCGGVFKLTASDGWAESLAYSFTASTGVTPSGLTAYKGNLYGVTIYGPKSTGAGSVYELTEKKGKWTHSTIYDLIGSTDGYEPIGFVTFDEGNIYGATPYGGTTESGSIYEISDATKKWVFTTIYSAPDTPGGAFPSALITDSKGNLYGSFDGGGSSACEFGCGSVFELEKTSTGWNLITLYEFSSVTDGEGPGALVFDSSGNLYGTTFLGGTGSCTFYQYSGCGTVFKLTKKRSSWTKSTVYDFTGGSDGQFPNGNSLAIDSSGNLYGLTIGGSSYGTSGYGSVFKIEP